MANANSIHTSRAPKQHPLDLDAELAALEQLSVGELRERFAELLGETTRSRHRTWLIRRIAWRLQANAEGDLSERARRRAEELAVDAEVRTTPPRNGSQSNVHTARGSKSSVAKDPRLPRPGMAITREYKGEKIEVIVQHDGFEWDGRRFKSLSAVAKAITGSHCNGFRFFNLGGK